MISTSMDIIQAIKTMTLRLSEIYPVEEAESIAHYYFENKLNFTRLQIYENRSRLISTDSFESDLQRLSNHEPVQYVLNKAWFSDWSFYVEKGVLIPRPETEELVLKVCGDLDKKNAEILDIGTGSGCIAVSLKKLCPETNVTAIDISDPALIVAGRNAHDLNTTINLFKDDILNPSEKLTSMKFDIIVSNPPYVRMSEKSLMQKNVVLHEPDLALYVSDDNPLLHYKAIANYAITNITTDGILYFEINEQFKNEICLMLKERGFNTIESFKDIHDKWRIVKARK